METGQGIIESQIGEFFGDEPWAPAEEELFKWLMFTYTPHGGTMKNLDNVNFQRFKERIGPLMELVYSRFQAIASENNSK
ncbi:hypothetical protein SAMN05216464_11864 [Mucilaginibacter pineti]|uniref:Uncharacterized protein n=1 Tax=Mucilaginibacter pineti TaxID=1391627 RepID=A0A1G7L7K5_9SPHI|nr:hypothetical protein [Mucilaginibacter pineti]SDF45356.1 hypothetical protein SAMN05216464_11864 [Mucilaginibacter pineti]